MSSLPHKSSSAKLVKTNERKETQLGMPLGTAWGRLRKSVLFHVLQRYGENVCFKCNTAIDTVNELSIEHKLPWQNNDTTLFWDMENIAFSHLRCNVPHGRPGPARKIGPEGTSWCSICSQFRPVKMFPARKARWNGLATDCYECRTKRNRRYNKKYREKYQLRLEL